MIKNCLFNFSSYKRSELIDGVKLSHSFQKINLRKLELDSEIKFF